MGRRERLGPWFVLGVGLLKPPTVLLSRRSSSGLHLVPDGRCRRRRQPHLAGRPGRPLRLRALRPAAGAALPRQARAVRRRRPRRARHARRGADPGRPRPPDRAAGARRRRRGAARRRDHRDLPGGHRHPGPRPSGRCRPARAWRGWRCCRARRSCRWRSGARRTSSTPPARRRLSLRPRRPVRFRVGPPVDLSRWAGREPTAQVLREATDAVMDAITAELEVLRGERAPAHRYDPRRRSERRPA